MDQIAVFDIPIRSSVGPNYSTIRTRDHTGIKIQVLMSYYAKLNGHIKIQVCGLVYAKT